MFSHTLPLSFHTSLEDLQTYPTQFASLLAYNQVYFFLNSQQQTKVYPAQSMKYLLENFLLVQSPHKNTVEFKERFDNVLKVLLFIYRSAFEFYKKQYSESKEVINMLHFVNGLRKSTQLTKEWMQLIITPFHESITQDVFEQLIASTPFANKMVKSIDYRVALKVASSQSQSTADNENLNIIIHLGLHDGTTQILKITSYRQLKEVEKLFASINNNLHA